MIRSITNTSGNYNKKYMKTKFNSDDYLPVGKMVAKSVFKEDNRYYPQVFLDECLYEL